MLTSRQGGTVSEWISVTERLPENRIYVMATNGTVVWISCRNSLGWTIEHPTITHWMELPKLPKKENYLKMAREILANKGWCNSSTDMTDAIIHIVNYLEEKEEE